MAQPLTPITIPEVGADNSAYWNDFYGSMGITGREPAGGGLTTRSIKTVKIDPFTGQPTVDRAALNANMRGRGQPARLTTAKGGVGSDRLTPGNQGLPLNPDGKYNAGNPLVLSALTAQQTANPAVAAATALAENGGIKPSWTNPQGRGPKFPVAATPEIELAYADVVAGKPGAMKRYGALLADQAQAGNFGFDQSQGAPAAPTTVKGSATGQPLKVGQTYTAGGYSYEITPNGPLKTGVDKSMANLTPSQRYDKLNGKPISTKGSGGQSHSLLYNAGLGDGEAA